MQGLWSSCNVPGPEGESLVPKEGLCRRSLRTSTTTPGRALCLRCPAAGALFHSSARRWAVLWEGALCSGREQLPVDSFIFLVFFSKLTQSCRRDDSILRGWATRFLPSSPQLTSGLLRPSLPSRSYSERVYPVFSPAHQGCFLAEKRTWLPASFLYRSRVSQCLAVPSASSARSLVTAKPGCGGGHPLCPLLWLKGSFQGLWHVPLALLSVSLSLDD